MQAVGAISNIYVAIPWDPRCFNKPFPSRGPMLPYTTQISQTYLKVWLLRIEWDTLYPEWQEINWIVSYSHLGGVFFSSCILLYWHFGRKMLQQNHHLIDHWERCHPETLHHTLRKKNYKTPCFYKHGFCQWLIQRGAPSTRAPSLMEKMENIPKKLHTTLIPPTVWDWEHTVTFTNTVAL